MVTAAIHLLRTAGHALERVARDAATPSLPPTLPTPTPTPPPTPPPHYSCPDGFSECSLGGCCSSEFGAWASMAMSFLGIMLVLLCCSCWKYAMHARRIRSAALLSSRPRTQRLSEASTICPSPAQTPALRASWQGEPPPVLPDEPPPLYETCVSVIPLPATGEATTAATLPIPPSAATLPTPLGRRSSGQ
ncbi:uncharacterized protein LOC126272469 [Schistocerca gregaria]|uniref:uncharacterized protein LOC126272469 n=1 Tax=Schistocerca gregaria TaxID=7010 RepID=UPI00211F1196|nr:uncharacterized protein LOC126272469 [Schistocerca gregaria]